MYVSELDYEELIIRKSIKEKTDNLSLPMDIKEKIYNIIYNEEIEKYNCMPGVQKYLKIKKLVEVDIPEINFRNISTEYKYK